MDHRDTGSRQHGTDRRHARRGRESTPPVPDGLDRRTLLRGIGAAAATGVFAGCTSAGPGGSSPTEDAEPPECDSYTTLTQSDVNGGATIGAGCYRIDDVHTVDSGTLTLESGVLIEFAADAGLRVASGGTLRTEGTGSDPVFLRGRQHQRAFWQGLRFNDSAGTTNLLENAVIEHAGASTWHGGDVSRGGLFVTGSAVEIRGSTLREHGQAGVVAPDADVDLAVSNTVFESNETPARLHGNLVGSVAADVGVRDNDSDWITVAGTGSSDAITTDQSWDGPGVPYHVDTDLSVQAHLTVEPATVLRFAAGTGLDVNGGRLTVAGTSGGTVTFRGETDGPGSWRGIRFVNAGSAPSVLEHAAVWHAGGSLWTGADRSRTGIYVQGDDVDVTIRDTTFLQNDGAGLLADGGDAKLAVERCEFGGAPASLRLHADLVAGLGTDHTFLGNDDDRVQVGVQGSETSVSRDATWPSLEVPYRLTRDLYVNAALEVSPGTTVAADEDVGVSVSDGSLRADASASSADAIVFTGAEDQSGFWRGISYNSASADNVLDDVVVEDAGSAIWTGNSNSAASVYIYGGEDHGAVTVRNSTIRGSGNHGIAKDRNGDLTCAGVTFQDVAGNDLHEMYGGPIAGC